MSSGRRPRTKSRVEECASVSLDGISISLEVTLKLENAGERVNICSRISKKYQTIKNQLVATNPTGPSDINESIWTNHGILHPYPPPSFTTPRDLPAVHRIRKYTGSVRSRTSAMPTVPEASEAKDNSKISEARIPGCSNHWGWWIIDPDISWYIQIYPFIYVEKWRWTRIFPEIWHVNIIIIIHHPSYAYYLFLLSCFSTTSKSHSRPLFNLPLWCIIICFPLSQLSSLRNYLRQKLHKVTLYTSHLYMA